MHVHFRASIFYMQLRCEKRQVYIYIWTGVRPIYGLHNIYSVAIFMSLLFCRGYGHATKMHMYTDNK